VALDAYLIYLINGWVDKVTRLLNKRQLRQRGEGLSVDFLPGLGSDPGIFEFILCYFTPELQMLPQR